MLRTLGLNYRSRGGILQQGAEVSELLMENGRCVGASVRQNGVTRAIRAQYVVLSDGGFQANADLLRRFISGRSEEHTSELQSLMRISYAVFCLKKKKKQNK